MNSGGYLLSRKAARLISTTFTDTEVNNCFSIYHTSWITSGPKSNFIDENVPTKAILFFFGCLEVNSTWLITSGLANQRARKVLFTCVVYTNNYYYISKLVRALWLVNLASHSLLHGPLKSKVSFVAKLLRDSAYFLSMKQITV